MLLSHCGDPEGFGFNVCTNRITALGVTYSDVTCGDDGDFLKLGALQRYNLSMQGGVQSFTHALSANYRDEDSPFDGSKVSVNHPGYVRDGGFRANFTFQLSPTLNAQRSTSVNLGTTRWVPAGSNGTWMWAISMSRGPSGTIFQDGKPASALAMIMKSYDKKRQENALYGPSYLQFYTSVFGTPWADLKDPRTAFVLLKDAKGAQQISRDGRIPMYAQAKYPTRLSDIPIASGVEMLLLRAEAAFRNKDLAGSTTLINSSRAQAGLGPVTASATEAAAWTLLKVERGATLWLEGRRFWDLSRWYAEGLDKTLEGRAKCIPIGKTELLTNANLKGLL